MSGQHFPDRLQKKFIDAHFLRKSDFHLCGMNIHIYPNRIHIHHQHTERVFVLHQVRSVTFLQRFGYQTALNISAVQKIEFIISVGTVTGRFSKETGETNALPLPLNRD